MCGRYAQAVDPSELPFLFGQDNLTVDRVENTDKANPRYNIGPTQNAPVYFFTTVTNHPNPQHIIRYMKWGVIPFWEAKKNQSKAKSTFYNTFNAKLESISEGHRLWKSLRGKYRCIVPIQGYYEWNTIDSKTKKPYYITRKDGKFMYLAGLYSTTTIHNTSDDGISHDEEVSSFTIITGPAPNQLKWLHPRMPVVLEPDSEELHDWLNPAIDEWCAKVEGCLKPYERDTLDCYPVAKDVGNVRNEGKYLTEQVKDEETTTVKEEGIKKWFMSPKKERSVAEATGDKEPEVKSESKSEVVTSPLSSPTKPSRQKFTPSKPIFKSNVNSKNVTKKQMSIDHFLSKKEK